MKCLNSNFRKLNVTDGQYNLRNLKADVISLHRFQSSHIDALFINCEQIVFILISCVKKICSLYIFLMPLIILNNFISMCCML